MNISIQTEHRKTIHTQNIGKLQASQQRSYARKYQNNLYKQYDNKQVGQRLAYTNNKNISMDNKISSPQIANKHRNKSKQQPKHRFDVVKDSFMDSQAKDVGQKASKLGGKAEKAEQAGSFVWQKRWTIVILCFVAFMLCNMDRVNMSIAILPMKSEFNWNLKTVGLIQSSFFWGYLLTQVAGGIWADQFGGKKVLGFGVIWWSVATVLTPIAARMGLMPLLLVRTCMGVGEGVAMPAMNNMISKWVPIGERSRSLAFVYSGMHIGSVIALLVSPHMIQSMGWSMLFYGFGSLGIVWYFFWYSKASDAPAKDTDESMEEKNAIINKTSAPAKEKVIIPWRQILSKRAVWAIIVCHFCHNYGLFILLTWMPTYYTQVLHFNLQESSMYSVLPWLSMALVGQVGGYLSDLMIQKGFTVTFTRKLMQSIGFLGPAFFLSQLSTVSTPLQAVLCMMFSQGLDSFSHSGIYSNHQDIGPKYAGILLGLSNTAGVLAGVVGTAATGYILSNGTWNDVWKVAIGLYIFGTIVWNVFATGEKIID